MAELKYLTSEEVLQLLRISKPTLTRWVRDGIIPAVRLGPRQLRFPKADLLNWVESQRTDRVAPAPHTPHA